MLQMDFYGTCVIIADKQDGSGKVIVEHIENSKNVYATKEHSAREFDTWEDAVNFVTVWNRLAHIRWWDPFYNAVWLQQN